MEWQSVVLVIVACFFVFGMACLFLLYSLKKIAVKAIGNAVDKTIDRATDLVSEKVLEPTMAVATQSMKKGLETATDGMKQGLDAVGQVVKDEYQESKRKSAGNLDVEVTRLAKLKQGKVTVSELVSELKLSSDEAKLTFARLEKSGHCAQINDGLFHFDAFLLKKKVWFCEYCENKMDQDPKRNDCSDCGAQLSTREEIE